MDAAMTMGLRRALVAIVVIAGTFAALPRAQAQDACPPACAGKTLTSQNFSHQNLDHANFEGATIVSGVFVRATLTHANFNGATFIGIPGYPGQTTDFSFADLSNATFVGAKFQAPTYFTYATLTCADFSQTDISTGNAVFGDEPLVYFHDPNHPPACRTRFQHTKMNCEFIGDWRNFDLTASDVSACIPQLAGRDLSYSVLSQVDLSDAYLARTDFSFAVLQGTKLARANLTGATFYNAVLSNNDGNIELAATLEGAQLKNVNFASAQLGSVTFTNANFYGDAPANSAGCATTLDNGVKSGFTKGCASAFEAKMTGTSLTGAYLFGVDFTSATINGADFTDAVLTGANFSSAKINPSNGVPTKFIGAYLQGVQLDNKTALAGADLTNAFVDFRKGGNNLVIELSGAVHNTFACPPSPGLCPVSGADVCVWVAYGQPTSVPPANTDLSCPNPSLSRSPCGAAGDAHWKSGLDISQTGNGPPPGWYLQDATYAPRTAMNAVCNGQGTKAVDKNW